VPIRLRRAESDWHEAAQEVWNIPGQELTSNEQLALVVIAQAF